MYISPKCLPCTHVYSLCIGNSLYIETNLLGAAYLRLGLRQLCRTARRDVGEGETDRNLAFFLGLHFLLQSHPHTLIKYQGRGLRVAPKNTRQKSTYVESGNKREMYLVDAALWPVRSCLRKV